MEGGHTHHHHAVLLPHVPVPGEVFGLRVTGRDSQCGLCCNVLKGPSGQVDKQYALTIEASSCVSLQEVNEFVDKINVVLRDTHMPIIPLIFTHFLLPFSPICILACYSSRRQTQLKALVEEMNTKALVRNCHW
jgi:hypothetical protein